MFSFLKEKLKGAISKFTKGAEEAAEEKPDPEQAITADQAALKAEKKGSDKETKAEQATKLAEKTAADKAEQETEKHKKAEQAKQKEAEKEEKETRHKEQEKKAEQAAKQKDAEKEKELAAKQKEVKKEKELAAKQKDAEKEKELAAKQKEVKKEKEAEKEEKEARQKEKEKEVELAAKLAEKEVEKVEQEKKAEQAKQEKEAEKEEKETRHKEQEKKAEQAKQQEAEKAEQAAKLAEKTIAEKAEQETDLTEKSEKEAAATQIPSSAQPQKRSWKERIFGPKTVQEGTPAPSEDPTEKQEKKEKKGIFTSIKDKVTRTVLSPEKFDDLFWELEIALLENNVAVEVIEKIREDLKTAVSGKPMLRGKLEETIAATLQASIRDILSVKIPDLLGKIQEKKPYIICFIGINGSGKTTTISKIARRLKEEGLEVVLAAGDTFRAAAIDQLTIHADNLGVKIIKHDYGSDSAAVAFDAVKHAEAKGKDVVLIDTAGRMHSNANLMDELKKVVRVAKPDLKIFVGESITGNDCVEQAQQFDSAVGIDGIILTKADIDEKGGAALSISYVTRKPIYFIGVGQGYEDLKPFSPDLIMSSLGL